jgi:hypothetical protein
LIDHRFSLEIVNTRPPTDGECGALDPVTAVVALAVILGWVRRR